MATLIRRSDALRAINALEEKARENGKHQEQDAIIKCFNAVMSCPVERKIFCNECGKRLKAEKDPRGGFSPDK